MRVVSGTAKGRVLAAPKGLDTRPTADRIKQSLFNMIAPDLNGACFLDLFAGSGAIGIEALSRGARKCVFVENNREAMRVILRNIEHAKLSDKAETYMIDAESALKLISKKNERFNIIFMDPPYEEAAFHIKRLTDEIRRLGLLERDGYIIGEHGAEIDISSFENINLHKVKSYGKTTVISFWRYKQNGDRE